MSTAPFHRLSLVPQMGLLDGTPPSRHIIVIDDSPTVCKILETCLQREGFAVTCFADGIAALRWLNSAKATTPDMIILDLILPRMDGIAVARWLRNMPLLQQTPVILLTRCEGILYRLKARLSGAQMYLTKPFKTEEIVAVVRYYLDKRCEPGC